MKVANLTIANFKVKPAICADLPLASKILNLYSNVMEACHFQELICSGGVISESYLDRGIPHQWWIRETSNR